MKQRPLFHSVCAVAVLASTALAQPGKKNLLDEDYQFAPGVRLLSGGKPIDVTTGHAAPYLYDFDGDGTRDLLVGEFGSGRYTGEKTTDNGPLANAPLRIYLNKGTEKLPVYEGFKYLQADGENASVPST